MKKVQLIAYINRQGFSLEDLKDHKEIFYSPIECFNDSVSDTFIYDYLCNKYKTEIDRLFNPKIKIKYL